MISPGPTGPPASPAPWRPHVLVLAHRSRAAGPVAALLRDRLGASHAVEVLCEPGEVAALIRTLQRTSRDGEEVEVVVADAAEHDTAEAAQVRARWPDAYWISLPPSLDALDAAVAEVLATVDAYRRHRRADLLASLGRMEILRGLGPARLAWIAERIVRRRYEGGEIVVRAGEPGDGVYFIRSGEVKVLDAEALGAERVIVRRGRGEHVGELALVTGEPRSNTVVAERDTEALFLAKAHYDALMLAEPGLGLDLSRVLSARLAHAHRRRRQRPHIIACCRVLPADPGAGTTPALAQVIAAETGRAVVLLELETVHASATGDPLDRVIARLDDPTPVSRDDCTALRPGLWRIAAARPESLRSLRRPHVVPALLDVLAQAFPFVVVGLGTRTPPDVLVRVAKQCDVLLLHVGREPERAQQARELLALLHRECPAAAGKIAVAAETDLSPDVGRAADHHLPVAPDDTPGRLAYRGVARRLDGLTVGLALGGGGARGAAHLGVLEVLADAGVPIDVIGGTSAGAMVGGGIAMGRSVPDAIECWRRETATNPLRHYAFSKSAVFSHHALEALLRRLYGDLHVERLPIPFFAVATDLHRAVATPLDRGPLWLAVRASCSLPGAIAPVRIGDTYFVDGGVANNVPADLVRARGARFVIAVDISREREFDDHRSRPGDRPRGVRRIPWLREFLDGPSILQVLTRAMEVQSALTVSARAWSWNVRVRPDVAEFPTLEVGTTDALLARGREAAARSLAEIKTGLRAMLDEL